MLLTRNEHRWKEAYNCCYHYEEEILDRDRGTLEMYIRVVEILWLAPLANGAVQCGCTKGVVAFGVVGLSTSGKPTFDSTHRFG